MTSPSPSPLLPSITNAKDWGEAFIKACLDNDLQSLKFLMFEESCQRFIQLDYRGFLGFRNACLRGHIDIVKFLLQPSWKPYLDKHHEFWINECGRGIQWACMKGHWKIVKECLQTSWNATVMDVNLKQILFKTACSHGQKDTVKFFLEDESWNQKNTFNIHANSEEAFIGACSGGHLDVVRYLLSEKVKEKYGPIDIEAQEGGALWAAVQHERNEVVKYLLSSSEMKNHGYAWADVHQNEDLIFCYVCQSENKALLDWLMLTYRMEITPYVLHFLNESTTWEEAKNTARVRSEMETLSEVMKLKLNPSDDERENAGSLESLRNNKARQEEPQEQDGRADGPWSDKDGVPFKKLENIQKKKKRL